MTPATIDPIEPDERQLRAWRRFRWPLADDIFISYSRADGATYAAGLASALAHRGFACRVDQWESEPGKDVPRSILRAIRHSQMLIVIGTAASGRSASVTRE